MGNARASEDDPPVGTTIGDRWLVLRRIAVGGTADIYAARDLGDRSRAALKILRPHLTEDPRALLRFEREYDTVRALNHPNLASVLDRGCLPDSRPWFAMELVVGPTLETLLREGPLPTQRALAIVGQVANALAHAHAAGIVHRDVCPSNVVVRRGDQATLVDFGIALDRAAERITLSGMQIGSPQWISPEAARGDPIGTAADVYGLGCLLFAAVCGRAPFLGSPMKVLEAHVSSPPPPLVIHVAGLPDWLDELVASLLAKNPDTRPSAAHLAGILDAAAQDLRAAEVHAMAETSTNPLQSYPVGVTQGYGLAGPLQPAEIPPSLPQEAMIYASLGGVLAVASLGIVAGVLCSFS